MKRIAAAALALAVASPLAAQPDWGTARRVEVTLSSFDFAPSTLRLKAGEPVVLRLVNASGGGHNFSAPAFFAAAQVREQDRGLLAKGAVEVPSHAERDVALVPAGGRYKLKCTHTMHTLFGMRGSIVVE